MRVISRQVHPKIGLNPIKLTSAEFVSILEDTFGNDERLKLVTGEPGNETRIELNGIDEIRSNLAIVETPLQVRFSSLELALFSYRQAIEYDRDTQIHASTLAKRLTAYTPLTFFALGTTTKSLLALLVTAAILLLPDPSLKSLLSALVMGALTYILVHNFFELTRLYMKASIRHYEKKNIVARNRDALFVALVGAIIGSVFTTLVARWNVIYEYIAVPLEEDGSK